MNGPSLPFAEALAHLRSLLSSEGWASRVGFVPEEHVLATRADAALVFRPPAATDLAAGEADYLCAQRADLPAELHAVGELNGTTIAYVRVLRELAQGENMFIHNGLKVSLSCPSCTLFPVKSRLSWFLHTFLGARRRRRALKRRTRAA